MSCRSTTSASLGVALAALALVAGCGEVRGRKLVREGNELYRRGRYAEAVAAFEQAEALVPGLPALWLNKGYTCRQLIAPGAADADSRRAVACALAAFRRFGELRPGDARADQLVVQTLFDADDFAALEARFLARSQQEPRDVEAALALEQVYWRWGKWREALTYAKRAAALRPDDAEAQYGVGTFVWQLLSSRGGGADMSAYDPRPRAPAEIPDGQSGVTRRVKPQAPLPPPPPPPAGPDAITGAPRATLADEGIGYLQRALALRPAYAEAMTYLGLLCWQKAFAFFAEPARWQLAVDEANAWQRKALAARGGKT